MNHKKSINKKFGKTENKKGYQRPEIRMRTLFASVLFVTMFAAIILVSCAEVQGADSFSNLDPAEITIITAANEKFTLAPGYIYTLEVAGGKGKNGALGEIVAADGGNGTGILVWLDLRVANNPLVFYGGTTTGGVGGQVYSNDGGDGGGAAYVLYENGTLMMIAGGGGGAAAVSQGRGGDAGTGSGTSHPTLANYILFNGSNGFTGVATSGGGNGGSGGTTLGGLAGTGGGGSNVSKNGTVSTISGTRLNGGLGGGGGQSQSYGGGGGGSGYSGGGGGANSPHSGGGGGGGSSLVYVGGNFSLGDYSFRSNNNDTTAKLIITRYNPPTVSGTVRFTEEYGGGPINNASVTYCIDDDFAHPLSVSTDPNGEYMITAYEGMKITILNVEKPFLTRVTPLPAPFTMNACYTGIDFEMTLAPGAFIIEGNVTLNPAGTGIPGVELEVKYSNGSPGGWFDSWFTRPDGSYIIVAGDDYTVTIQSVTKYG